MKRTVLITGGSRGIGAAAVLAYAAAGYDVAFTWHADGSAAQQVVQRANRMVPERRVVAIRADVADSEQVNVAVRTAEQLLGGVEVLVCNAGVAQQKLFTDITDDDWRKIMAWTWTVHFTAAARYCPA